MYLCVETPAIDDMPMIEPPPLRAITGAACLIARNVPVMLRSIVARKLSTSESTIGPRCNDPPAHAKSTSRPPVASVATATARATSSSFVTSATT